MKKKMTVEELHKEMSKEISGIKKTLGEIYEWIGWRGGEEPEEKHTWKKIGNFEFSEDLGEMNWDDATKKCKEIGGRLPTRGELLDLFDNHREELGMVDSYWSSTGGSSYAWSVVFSNGSVSYRNKRNSFSVRCVRKVTK